MSEVFTDALLGHLVCLVQANAFIMVEWAYLGRGKLRWPVLWAELLCMGQLGLSLATGMSFFNVQSVLLNVLYLFVTAQLFGGNFADKLTACLINGTMCLLVENTVNYTYSWFTGVRTGEAWQHPGCLIALCAANFIVGAAVAHSLYSWNQKCALQPLQALVMSFFPGVAVVLNIVLMVTGTRQPATRMTMLLTFGMSVAVLVHIAIVQMFNDQVVQRQNSRYRAQLEQQRAEALLDSYTEQRRLTHEFTNHMSALSALLDQDDLKGARTYLASVSKLVAAGTVQMFNDQVVQRQNSRYRAQLEQQRAEALLDSYTEQRRLTHEFTNHMSALSALLDQDDLKGARTYLASVSKLVAAGTTIMDTHNPLLDSILSKKYEEAAQKGVTVYFDLCDLKEIPFDGMDMVIVLSNLLDNAICAAAQALPPEVYVRIRKTPEEYLLSVRNRVQDDLDLEDNKLPGTTKKESGHGMGFANVQEVLRKYGAEYTVSCRDRWFRFTCAIPVCNS